MDLILGINDKQAEVIVRACELWARIGTGELTALLHHPDVSRRLTTDTGITTEEVRRLLENLKTAIFGLPGSAYYGITATETGESNRIAYDLIQVIRHSTAFVRQSEQPETPPPVHYDPPYHTSSEPLPTLRQRPNDPI